MRNEDDVVALIYEAKLMQRLKHRNIVRLLGIGSADTSSPEAEWRSLFLVRVHTEMLTMTT